jgi:hypothetical protein
MKKHTKALSLLLVLCLAALASCSEFMTGSLMKDAQRDYTKAKITDSNIADLAAAAQGNPAAATGLLEALLASPPPEGEPYSPAAQQAAVQLAAESSQIANTLLENLGVLTDALSDDSSSSGDELVDQLLGIVNDIDTTAQAAALAAILELADNTVGSGDDEKSYPTLAVDVPAGDLLNATLVVGLGVYANANANAGDDSLEGLQDYFEELMDDGDTATVGDKTYLIPPGDASEQEKLLAALVNSLIDAGGDLADQFAGFFGGNK